MLVFRSLSCCISIKDLVLVICSVCVYNYSPQSTWDKKYNICMVYWCINHKCSVWCVYIQTEQARWDVAAEWMNAVSMVYDVVGMVFSSPFTSCTVIWNECVKKVAWIINRNGMFSCNNKETVKIFQKCWWTGNNIKKNYEINLLEDLWNCIYWLARYVRGSHKNYATEKNQFKITI